MDDQKDFKDDEIDDLFEEDRFREETGTEIAPGRNEVFPENRRDEYEVRKDVDDAREGTGWGITALVMSILSLLSIMPVTLGIAAIVVGIIAYNRGSRGLAIWSMVIAAISLINQFFIAPFIT